MSLIKISKAANSGTNWLKWAGNTFFMFTYFMVFSGVFLVLVERPRYFVSQNCIIFRLGIPCTLYRLYLYKIYFIC